MKMFDFQIKQQVADNSPITGTLSISLFEKHGSLEAFHYTSNFLFFELLWLT